MKQNVRKTENFEKFDSKINMLICLWIFRIRYASRIILLHKCNETAKTESSEVFKKPFNVYV